MSRDIQHRNSLNSLAPHVHKAFFGILCVAVAALLVVGCATLDAKPTSISTSNKPSVKVGIDIYEPYTYYDDNGQITGFDYELAVPPSTPWDTRPSLSASRGNTRTSFLNRAPSTASGRATA